MALGAVAAGLVGVAVAVPAGSETYWLFVLWAAWVGAVGWIMLSRRPSLAMAGLEVFVLLDVLVPATIAVRGGRTMIGIYDVSAGTVGALQLSTIAQVAVLVGALLARLLRPAVPRRSIPAPTGARRLDRWAVFLVLGSIAALVTYVVLAKGNPASLVVLVGQAKYNDFLRSAQGPVVKYFASLVGLAGAAIIVVSLRVTLTSRRHLLVPAGAALASVGLLTASGGRSQLAVPIVAAVLVWWRVTPGGWARRPRRVLLVGALGLFAFAVLVGGLRDQSGVKTIDTTAFVDKQVHGGVFATTSVLVDTVPSRFDHLEGTSYLEVLALPVPRTLWPDKPEGVIKDLQRAFFRSEIGAAFPFYGELYANFGWIGAAIGSVGFGLFLETVWLRLVAATRTSTVVVCAALVAMLLQAFSRGYLAGVIAGFFGLAVGVVLVARGLRRAERRARRRDRDLAGRPGRPDSTQRESATAV